MSRGEAGASKLADLAGFKRRKFRRHVHTNRRGTSEWTLILADAATDAQIGHDARTLQMHVLAVRRNRIDFFQAHGFFQHRTHFLAHNARAKARPRDATILIDVCHADIFLRLPASVSAGIAPVGQICPHALHE